MKTKMKNVSKKTVALIASFFMATTALGFTGMANLDVHAAEEDSYVIEGVGSSHSVNVEVSAENPPTLTTENVTVGQYYIVAAVDTPFYVDLYAEVTGETYPAYLSYNSTVNAYMGTVTIDDPKDVITLSTYSSDTYAATVYLEDLFIGESTDYTVAGLRINSETSRKVNLMGISGDYVVSVSVEDYPGLEPSETPNPNFYVQFDGGDKQQLNSNPFMFDAYTETFEIADGTNSITVSTDYTGNVNVTLSLYQVIEVDTPLPTTTPANFNLYETYSFVYELPEDMPEGRYVMNYAASGAENVEFSILMKVSPNDFSGTTVVNNTYPLYFAKGVKYYFDISYTGVAQVGDEPATPPSSITATFSFAPWTAPAVTLNETVYVPVTVAEDDAVEVKVTGGEEGVHYNVGLSDVPYGVETIHVTYNGTTATINEDENNFTLEIVYAEGATISFYSEWTYEFAAGVTLEYATPEYDDAIELDEDKSITLMAGQTLTYYVQELINGDYTLTLTDEQGVITVSDIYDNTLIAAGETSGIFDVLLDYPNEYGYFGETSRTVPLYFTNTSEQSVTFTAKVTRQFPTLPENADTSITVKAGETYTYFVPDLTDGDYMVALDGVHSGITVFDYNDRFSPLIADGASGGLFNVTLVPANPDLGFPGESSRTIGLVFVNNSGTDRTFTVSIYKTNVLTLGVAQDITVEAGMSEDYNIALATGTYTLSLSGADNVTVTVNGSEYRDEIKVDVAAGKTEVVKISFANGGAEAVTFTALVNPVPDGTLTLNEAANLTLSYTDDTQSYTLTLEQGLYQIALGGLNGEYIQVSLDGDVMQYMYSDNTVFEVYNTTTITVTFVYYGETSISFKAIVNALGTMTYNVDQTVTLSENNFSVAYTIELEAGDYSIEIFNIDDASEVEVFVGYNKVISEGATYGQFTIYENTTIVVTFAYSGTGNITFTAAVY